MIGLLLALGLAHAQDCAADEDCDDDGWSIDQGDCDDDDAAVHPGLDEICANELDDNCNRLFNEGCDRSARQGQLWGGSACRGSEDGSPELPLDAAFLLPLIALRRRGPPS